jgi:hypothetical protein
MPMRCANRVSVLHNKAWRSTSISFAASQAPFEILGQNTGSRKPPDQLPTRFRTHLSATLINQDSGSDIAKTPSDAKTAVSVGQGLRAVRQLTRPRSIAIVVE